MPLTSLISLRKPHVSIKSQSWDTLVNVAVLVVVVVVVVVITIIVVIVIDVFDVLMKSPCLYMGFPLCCIALPQFCTRQSVSQWVSQWVTDKHSQWSDSGPIKMNVHLFIKSNLIKEPLITFSYMESPKQSFCAEGAKRKGPRRCPREENKENLYCSVQVKTLFTSFVSCYHVIDF